MGKSLGLLFEYLDSHSGYDQTKLIVGIGNGVAYLHGDIIYLTYLVTILIHS